MKRLIWWLALASIAGHPNDTWAASINEIKAAYLYNFTKYTQWPWRGQRTVFELCVLNDEEFYAVLQPLEGKRVFGAALVTRKLQSTLEQLEECELIYLGENSSYEVADLRKLIGDLPILIVSTGDKPGGMIQFTVVDSKLRFIIDKSMLTSQGLAINARILALAYKVTE
jgi:hypothetical protein